MSGDSLIPPSDRPTPRQTQETALHAMAMSAATEATRWAKSHLLSRSPEQRLAVRSLVSLAHDALDLVDEMERLWLSSDPTDDELRDMASRVLPIRERVSAALEAVGGAVP